NRVAGEFGTLAAWSANPQQASNSVSPPRVTRQQPDRSRSRAQLANVAAASAKEASLIRSSCQARRRQWKHDVPEGTVPTTRIPELRRDDGIQLPLLARRGSRA